MKARLTGDTAEARVAALLKQVGERVHTARKAKRLSRRELSELSGVSPRYLVQLEGGEGNVSIGLLQRIALALELPVESFVEPVAAFDDEGSSHDVARLVMHYRNADAATRAQVLSVLDPEHLRERRAQRVCLIGLRGAGKSTLGARLGKTLGLAFVELNQEIEQSSGMPIGDVIAMYGAEGYRKLEADTLKTLIATRERFVLAVAGGVVEDSDTFAEVLRHFHTVWLRAKPIEHMERVREQGDLRPMADNPQAMQQLRDILQARESRYRQADYHLDTSGKTLDASLTELCALIKANNLVAITSS